MLVGLHEKVDMVDVATLESDVFNTSFLDGSTRCNIRKESWLTETEKNYFHGSFYRNVSL